MSIPTNRFAAAAEQLAACRFKLEAMCHEGDQALSADEVKSSVQLAVECAEFISFLNEAVELYDIEEMIDRLLGEQTAKLRDSLASLNAGSMGSRA